MESWSEIEDTSGTEDDPTVIKKKRILRHGRKRLSEMRDRFNAAKARLFDEKKNQLDVEWAQLQNGTHPQYLEFIGQVDARWTDRLSKIDLKLDCNRNLAINNLESTRKTALSTFAASRSELRQRMIYRRKRRLWALADELRGLERVSEAIANIACPLSSHGTNDGPVRGALAPPDSEHLLELPDTRLSKVDEDSDVAAIRGIPALLNNSDVDVAPGNTAGTGYAQGGMVAEGVDAQYAQSGYPSTAYQYQNEADYARAYGQYSTASQQQQQPQQQVAAVPSGDRGYYESTDYRYAQPGYYNSEAAASGYAAGYPTDGRYQHAISADQRHSASQSRVADITHPNTAQASAAAYSQAYYDNTAPSATPVSTLTQQHGGGNGKREAAVEYDDTPSKRQRMVQQPGSWTTLSQTTRPEYGRVAADPGPQQAYAYSQHAYNYGHPQQNDYQYAHAAAYYGSSKYEYPSTYYQQPPATGYSGANGSQPMHYQHADTYYQSSGASYQQQPGYAADYRSANGTSYSGLETGIAMGQANATEQYGRYAQPLQQQHAGAWNEYQHTYGHSGVGAKTPQTYYSRQPMPPAGRDYYDHNGYYAATTPQQSQ
ncbi:hypothetical protein IWW36_000735 [Coemansia brasiliensis]|uniref:Uncharacterized protein n=1 Tax=Coemansia brasiliensis TaxID=2650707 RepID=A0A9W8ID19_9FUNG|nr:hypothetical protein IWW36_000735 [Coemansia brasiliensis]